MLQFFIQYHFPCQLKNTSQYDKEIFFLGGGGEQVSFSNPEQSFITLQVIKSILSILS